MPEKQFPRRCFKCKKMEVYHDVIPYTARVKHDNCLYTFPIAELQIQKCRSCGEILFDNDTDDQISQGLREHLHLLSPQQIRGRLKQFGLMQKEFADCIRVAPETVCRWLSGTYIQSRAMDELMRLFFEREEVKHTVLQSGEVSLQIGEMPSWNYPTPCQIEMMNKSAQDTTALYIPVLPSIDAGMSLEMTRGPPACETILINHI